MGFCGKLPGAFSLAVFLCFCKPLPFLITFSSQQFFCVFAFHPKKRGLQAKIEYTKTSGQLYVM
jgi:hypothetical protein